MPSGRRNPIRLLKDEMRRAQAERGTGLQIGTYGPVDENASDAAATVSLDGTIRPHGFFDDPGAGFDRCGWW